MVDAATAEALNRSSQVFEAQNKTLNLLRVDTDDIVDAKEINQCVDALKSGMLQFYCQVDYSTQRDFGWQRN